MPSVSTDTARHPKTLGSPASVAAAPFAGRASLLSLSQSSPPDFHLPLPLFHLHHRHSPHHDPIAIAPPSPTDVWLSPSLYDRFIPLCAWQSWVCPHDCLPRVPMSSNQMIFHPLQQISAKI